MDRSDDEDDEELFFQELNHHSNQQQADQCYPQHVSRNPSQIQIFDLFQQTDQLLQAALIQARKKVQLFQQPLCSPQTVSQQPAPIHDQLILQGTSFHNIRMKRIQQIKARENQVQMRERDIFKLNDLSPIQYNQIESSDQNLVQDQVQIQTESERRAQRYILYKGFRIMTNKKSRSYKYWHFFAEQLCTNNKQDSGAFFKFCKKIVQDTDYLKPTKFFQIIKNGPIAQIIIRYFKQYLSNYSSIPGTRANDPKFYDQQAQKLLSKIVKLQDKNKNTHKITRRN